jgi:hypothetical protein
MADIKSINTLNVLQSLLLCTLGAILLFGGAGCAPKGPTGSGTGDKCSSDYNACMNYCDLQDDGHDGSPRAKCMGQCNLELLRCDPSRSSVGTGPLPPAYPPKGVK